LGSPAGTSTYNPGTVTLGQGGTIVTGVGTTFRTQFACNGTDSFTMADGMSSANSWFNYGLGAFDTPTFYTVKVASCSSNTSLTLAAAWPGTGSGGTNMFYNAIDPNWQGADGGAGNLGAILPYCSSGALPCGDALFVPQYGKPLGMASGAGNAPIAMADRLGGLAAVNNRTFAVAFDLAGVPNATQVTVRLTRPDQSVVSNTCSSSPCVISSDVREGFQQLAIQYQAASGAILSSSTQQVFLSTP
jgi:hypothetical protein